MKTAISIWILILLIALPVSAADKPMDVLKEPIERGLEVLRDPAFQDESQKETQRDRMWEIIRSVFDFEEVSKRAVARGWRDFTPEQKREFTLVFSKLLGNTYIGKLQGEYSDETVEFLEEDMVTDRKVVVKTNILRRTTKIPVDYSMLLRNDRWWVYDVHVEGVSLVLNYRSQFRKLLANESPAELIERLKHKVEDQAANSAAAE